MDNEIDIVAKAIRRAVWESDIPPEEFKSWDEIGDEGKLVWRVAATAALAMLYPAKR
jgi:hypothetical protein